MIPLMNQAKKNFKSKWVKVIDNGYGYAYKGIRQVP